MEQVSASYFNGDEWVASYVPGKLIPCAFTFAPPVPSIEGGQS